MSDDDPASGENQKPLLGAFRDVEDSRFYRSTKKRLSPEETFVEVWESLARSIAGVHVAGPRRAPVMSDEALTRIHRAIFGGLFRELDGAGRYRQAHEPASFGVPVCRQGRWSTARVDGAEPIAIRRELKPIFVEWGDWATGQTGTIDLAEATLALAKLYTGILRVHPFVDGNHRTCYVVLARVLWWLDLPLVRFRTAESKREHDRAAALALLGNLDEKPFADLLRIRLEKASKGAKL